MNFHNASFKAAYGTSEQLPASTGPEVSFAGRSNVGKSSLLNKLMYRKDLAKVSSTPGKTATINFYDVDGHDLVDLPGYGYAKVSKAEKGRWSELIEGYYNQDRDFALVVSLIDIRHEPSALDRNMVQFLMDAELPFAIALTKADKLSKQQQMKQRAAIKKALKLPGGVPMVVTSSEKGDGIDELRARIVEMAGEEFNLDSPKQLGHILFEVLGLRTLKKNQRGYSTDAATLESLRPYSPVIDEILKYRTYAKLLSTYVDGLLAAQAADGRVHSTFIQTETRTGRISSTEPNLQNIPVRMELGREIRRAFIARPGWMLVDADYSQIELRLLAHISGDEAMQEAFLSGEDIHATTAAHVFGVPLDQVTPAMRRSARQKLFLLTSRPCACRFPNASWPRPRIPQRARALHPGTA